ncbi:MAG: hypothetical protein PUC23_02255, partial [bacterium]|nr:hypothetical protein [bacterium]
FNNFISIKSFFEKNNIDYKNYMSINEVKNILMLLKEKFNLEDYMAKIKRLGESSYIRKKTM